MSILHVGLAATLQACVVARINEDYGERQKRNDINTHSVMQNGNITITPTAHIKTEGRFSLDFRIRPISYTISLS